MNKLTKTTNTMTRWITVSISLCIVLLMAGMILFQMGVLGLGGGNVVADMKARLEQSGADPESYQYMTSRTDSLFVVLAYRDGEDGARQGGYALYVNRPGFDFGWHFQTSDDLGEGVVQAEVEEYGSVWLSLNQEAVIQRVVYGDGTERAVTGYPLVDTASELHLYDENDQEISVLEKP